MDFIFDPSLVLYLPLYELDGASFMSKDTYGQVCTVTGALWRPNGRYFDGTDDYITLPSIAYGTCFSVIAWVNVDDLTEHRQWLGLDIYIALWISTTGYIQINIGDGAWGNNFNSDVGEAVVHTWYHLVGTYDGARTELFKNGEHLGGAANTKNVGSRVCEVGRNAGLGTNPFSGLIGEVLVYNRALTALEIQHNYLATKWRYR